jgi:hypothetical protein
MTVTCIYYDLDEIGGDDLRRAREYSGGAKEFIAAGVTWPETNASHRPRVVPSSRSVEYQADLMAWVDRLYGALTAAGDGTNRPPHQDPVLLEIARYHFFFDFAAVEQRWRAISEIVRSVNPDRLIWVAPQERIGRLRAISNSEMPTRLEFVLALKSFGLRTFLRDARRLAGPLLRRFRRRLLHLRTTQRALSPADSRIVFTEYFPNNVKGLLPVAKALEERCGIEPNWLAQRETVAEALGKAGVAASVIAQYVDDPGDERIPFTAGECKQFQAALDRLPDDVYRGTGQLDGREYLKPALTEHLTASLEQARYWLAALTAAFDLLRPRCVVSTSYSSIPGRAAAVACGRRGGKSIYVQHGLFPDRSFFTRFCNDILLLWGESNRRFMTKQGIAAERVHVVGASNYDDLIARSRSRQAKPIPQPGAPLAVALMASRTAGAALSYSAAQSCLSNIVRAVAKIPAARLVVKVHPGDKTGMVARTVGHTPGCTVSTDGNSQDVILESDIVIVISSTTGLEACVADKPLIVLEPDGAPNFAPYEQYGAALKVALSGDGDWQQIASAIELLQRDPTVASGLAAGRRRLVDDMLDGGRGDAAALAAAAISSYASASELMTARPLQGV